MEDNSNKYLREKLIANHWWFRARTKITYDVIKSNLTISKKKNIKILDIGCGTGQISKELKKIGKVFCVEPDKQSYRECKKNNPDIVIWNEYFPDKNSLKYKYDLICMFDFLEHVSTPDIILKEVHRRLTANGIIFITVPAYQWMWSNIDVRSNHFKRYSKKLLMEETENSGFKNLHASYFMMFLFPLAILTRKVIEPLIKNYREIDNLKGSNISFLNPVLEYLFSIESIFLKKKLFLPFGLSIIGVFKKA